MWPAHRNSGLVRKSGEEELVQVRKELEERNFRFLDQSRVLVELRLNSVCWIPLSWVWSLSDTAKMPLVAWW